ncbi:hypothetical protein [Sulfitobacter sp.]|uniref:hypothetical protein n=1 Tax=Sulfitobacter sp. TaxID=1903071 RepID=UPI003001D89F
MTLSTMKLSRDPEFEPFLGAQMGQDQRGANVSVLSMLARLEIDPWSDLADMKEITARKRLEALLGRFKDVPTLVTDRSRVALALLAHLPERRPKTKTAAKEGAVQSRQLPFGMVMFWGVAAVLLFIWVTSLAQVN